MAAATYKGFRFFNFVIALFAIAALGMANTANAQTADGFGGWESYAGGGGGYATAYEACYAQWVYQMHNYPDSRFVGATANPDEWSHADCEWTRYQFLCPAETGGGINGCGTKIPGYVKFKCDAGYTRTVDGHCRPDDSPSERCAENGRPQPLVGNPISIATGAKLLGAEDYSTADGDFRIGRQYRCFQVGRQLEGTILPRSLPRWLAGGWNFDFGLEIQLGTFSGTPATPTARAAVLLPDGSGYLFVLQPDGSWIPDPTLGAANAPTNLRLEYVGTLPSSLADVKGSASTWRITDEADTVWTMQTRVGPNGGAYNLGWPTEMARRDGYEWTLAYNSDSSLASITDSFGRVASFTWHQFYTTSLDPAPAGSLPYPVAVASIDLPDGTSLQYTYDPPPVTSGASTSVIERLVKVERLSATSAVLDSVTYLYEDPRFPTHVTGVIDNRDVRVSTYAYDGQGRATLTEGADGTNSYEVAYSQVSGNNIRTVTNPLGRVEEYTFSSFTGAGPNDFRLTDVDGQASASTAASSADLSYASSIFLDDTIDEEGRTTATTRDALGRITSLVEAEGELEERTTTTTWHSTYNVPVSIARPGLTETYTYYTGGQLESITLTDTTTHSAPYSTNGQTRTTTYTWGANGRLLTVNGPLAASGSDDDITSYTYDGSGNLLTITDPLGHVTTYAGHDANGLPATMTDPNGIVTSYAYDDLGRVETVTVEHPSNSALDATTTLAYDAVGNVVSLTLPSTDALLFDYDNANRLVSMRAPSGERINYEYDAIGNVTRQTVLRADTSTASETDFFFDELGRLIRTQFGPSRNAQLAYDRVGNVTSSTSPTGHTTTSAFDALDRVVSVIAPDSGSTTLEYDGQDNLTSFDDPVSVETEFVYNGFGEVIQETSPDRGTNTYWYDAAGRLAQSSDGRGQVITYNRDFMGRVTSEVPTGLSGQTITYYWDTGGLSGSYEVGRLAKIVDGSGTTQFLYDHRGNLVARQQAIGTSTTAQLVYTYDLADRITQITYPSGRIVEYGYDSEGRVNLVQTKANSGVGSWTVIASGHTYEPFGAVSSLTLGNGLAVTNDWGDEGRLASQRLYRTSNNADVSHLSYRYDADSNIASIEDHVDSTNSVLYGYDEVGRLEFTVLDSGATVGAQTLTYTAGTNQLASLTSASGTRTFAYDARGNTDTESRSGNVFASTSYDGFGRLTNITRTDVGSNDFSYNGLDDRVTMALAIGGTRHFIYDADGRVMAEYGTSASDVKAEFIWMSPDLASGAGAFGGSDHVGGYAPLAVATPNGGGGIELNWVHGNHLGVPLAITDAAGNAATTPNDYLAPGFPGQSRVFADLYYNRYRDYDPVTGRYLQADPIGLEGDPNPYSYVDGNPVNRIDPMGLTAATAPRFDVGRMTQNIRQSIPRGLQGGLGRALGGAGLAGGAFYLIQPIFDRAGNAMAGARMCRVSASDDDNDYASPDYYDGPVPEEDGPCEIQKSDDELECNQWHITGGGNGLSRTQGFAVCMKTVMVRYGECLARGNNPESITTPLFLPTGRRGGPDRTRPRR